MENAIIFVNETKNSFQIQGNRDFYPLLVRFAKVKTAISHPE
jgi:hypothetical protein